MGKGRKLLYVGIYQVYLEHLAKIYNTFDLKIITNSDSGS